MQCLVTRRPTAELAAEQDDTIGNEPDVDGPCGIGEDVRSGRTKAHTVGAADREMRREGPRLELQADVSRAQAECVRERRQAVAAFALRNRQYAAYQRKWLRRFPSLIRVNGNRPAEEVADEILEMARTRQRLPADRAAGSDA